MAADVAAARAVRVRPYEPRDGPAVRAFWRRGFQEMAWDFTRTLGPVVAGGPHHAYRVPRPALALLATAGGARLALALARHERAGAGAAAAAVAVGLGGLGALHYVTLRAITAMCDDACARGDMADIAAHWQVAGQSAFFVAELTDGEVVGCVGVRRGGLNDEATAAGGTLAEPRSVSVWKVSTHERARGLGVARRLMAAAEVWAAEEARAERVVLMTASSGAKAFYARLGYALVEGSTRGTELSVWIKELGAQACIDGRLGCHQCTRLGLH